MGALVQQHSTLGTATTSATETFSACTAGNVMMICAATNENTGADTIDTPSGWTVLKTFRQGTADVRIAMFGKVSIGGETSQVVTSSASRRLQTWFGEFSGVSLTVMGSSTNGSSVGLVNGSTGSISGVVATDFFIGMIAVKNVATVTTSAGYAVAVVNNEGGAQSTQKLTLQVGYDLTPPNPSQISYNWPTPSAPYAALGVWLQAASGTVFLKSVSGAVSFVGAAPKKASTRKVSGAVSFVGARASSPIGRRLNGVLAPVGVLTPNQSIARALAAAAVSFSGAVNRAGTRRLTGAFTPVGALAMVKSVSKAVSGAISFVGAQSRLPAKLLTAAFTPSGALSRTLTLVRTLTANLFSSGAVNKSTNRRVTGSTTMSGALSESLPVTHFFGVFRPTGVVTHGLPARMFFAAFQASSSLAKFTSRQLVASLIASGVMNTQYIPFPPPSSTGGGGFGALMDDSFFQRYRVSEKWSHVKRVRVK